MKKRRQAKILEIISKYETETQEDLQKYLHEAGFEVTQATISRDIKELRLVKHTVQTASMCTPPASTRRRKISAAQQVFSTRPS